MNDKSDASMAAPAWLDALVDGGGPRYLQIADAIGTAVDEGRLRPGDRLPPQRHLARQLGLDLTTVTRAYAEARRRGLLDARVGQGSFVSHGPADDGRVADLSMNIPPPPPGDKLERMLRQGMNDVLARADVDTLMTYHWGAGSLADREAAAAWLEASLGRVDPARIAVVPGAQVALAGLVLAHSAPGDAVAAEVLSYPGLMQAVRQSGRRMVAVATDECGMLPDELERACRTERVRLLYLNPTIQNPTAMTMPAGRRQGILAVARAHGVHVIEDDPYSFLAAERPPALAQLAPDIVSHVATLSKSLTPGLRTAFVALPDAATQDGFALAMRALTLMGAPLMAALATQWIRSGVADAFRDAVAAEARIRYELAEAVLPFAHREGPRGFHIWQAVPAQWSLNGLLAAASAHGLGICTSEFFTVEGVAPKAIRISLGAVPDRRRLERALKVLADLLAQQRPALPAVVV
ncbi:PLP-dependent aminotransferase family protein [Kerstersia gyiorum]|jgi:DNA-binding transcriptional MocR family regulator|uniref:aminotransferase-like domain-containing protein n=1 Tax=Kerstersia gyiorum TaxID=206506 RepID=UPI00243014B2|nr:PLP-dependent aminotransferase family protein [Kerstersia gyiorum]MCH4270618.1 PLP-dependent aminotransferase family protein [Kerstersia gyiorum]MCI1230045.1 PLP-dependent aminotransferase family protein [Kerstersia gyiorum]